MTIGYDYDVLQRVHHVTQGGYTVAFYGGACPRAGQRPDPGNANGRRSGIARANSGGAGTTYAYDGADRIGTLTQSLTGSGAVAYTQGYDPANGLVSSQVSNSANLFSAFSPGLTYTADGLNRYATVGGLTPTYDGRQNLFDLSSTTPHFTYDSENNLLVGSGPPAMTLVRDALGRIQTKTASGATETFLYSGSMLVGEYDSSGNILARYVPGPGTNEAVVWYAGAGTTTPQWLHADPLGSTIAWSNATGGAIGQQAYDPFGQPQSWSGSRFSYTGQLMLGEAQLYDYKARAYSPSLGRFMQTDPAGYASDLNPYAYVGNGPLWMTDPSGMVDDTDPTNLKSSSGDSTQVGNLTINGQGNSNAPGGEFIQFFLNFLHSYQEKNAVEFASKTKALEKRLAQFLCQHKNITEGRFVSVQGSAIGGDVFGGSLELGIYGQVESGRIRHMHLYFSFLAGLGVLGSIGGGVSVSNVSPTGLTEALSISFKIPLTPVSFNFTGGMNAPWSLDTADLFATPGFSGGAGAGAAVFGAGGGWDLLSLPGSIGPTGPTCATH